ncbi:MAG: alpha-amylase [Phycisphaerales bacterium]|nr:MAG: alpha-amylase [Phycisphaerales bacterium]
MATVNGTMMQYFHWYTANDGSLWQQVKDEAGKLAAAGITALWLPPATKGAGGIDDVGYGLYDLYDLGQFEQHETTRTKYGTRQQYLDAIEAAHAAKMQVYADMVFNHRGGADRTEWVKAIRVKPGDRRFTTGEDTWIEAWTEFNFPGRAGQYSDFVWRYHHFTGVDYAHNLDMEQEQEGIIFKFLGLGKDWAQMVDDEHGNYDYLMYADLDMNHPEVRTELSRWGKWFVETTGVDGFRLDAVKHIQFSFFRDWLDHMRKEAGPHLFAVGEYWNPDDVQALHDYITHTHGKMSLFDAPLHRNFYVASRAGGAFDMRQILDNTLMQQQPALAVTLVENHDTQPLQALESPVDWWFKPLAYAIILLREQGYPCVFYPDYYGAAYTDKGYDINLAPVPKLPELLAARRDYAYGPQHDFLDDPHVIGWTREGTDEHANSGLAVLLSDGPGGSKWMYVGHWHAGKQFRDHLGHRQETVTIDEHGWAEFGVNGGSVSVWVPVP